MKAFLPVFVIFLLAALLLYVFSKKNNYNYFHIKYFLWTICCLITSVILYIILISFNFNQSIYIFDLIQVFHLLSIIFFSLHVESALKGYMVKISFSFFLIVGLFLLCILINNELISLSNQNKSYLYFIHNDNYSIKILFKLISILILTTSLIQILVVRLPMSIFIKKKTQYFFWVTSFLFITLAQSVFNTLNYFNFLNINKTEIIFVITRIFAFLSFTILALNPSIVYYLPKIVKPNNLKIKMFDKIEFIIKTNKFYLDNNFTLTFLSKKINISKRNISKSILSNSGKNFKEYINDLRIEQSIKYINNNFLEDYTTIALGEKCGFNSHQSFCRSFLRNTGTTPKKYSTTLLSS